MEHWDIHEFFEGIFNLEALGTFQVLKVDTSEGWAQGLDNIDELLWFLGFNAEVDGVHACKLVEQDSFALHDWLGGCRSYVS